MLLEELSSRDVTITTGLVDTSTTPMLLAAAVEAIDDPEASGEALRHVLVGGVHSVEDFSAQVAETKAAIRSPLTKRRRSSARCSPSSIPDRRPVPDARSHHAREGDDRSRGQGGDDPAEGVAGDRQDRQ